MKTIKIRYLSDKIEKLRYIDGKYMEDLRDPKLHWKGSFNQRIIDVQKSLQNSSLYLYHAE